MVRKLGICMLSLAVAALLATCGGKETAETGRIDAGMELLGKLEAKMLTVETGYPLGSPVDLKMEIKNISDQVVDLEFPTQQRYDFFVFKKGDLVWRWSYNKPFEETAAGVKLASGESLVFDEIWDTAESPEEHPGGEYQVVGVLTASFPIATNFVEIGLAD